MKVLIINRHVDEILGGSEIQCDLIARNLTQLGHQVIYVAMESNSNIINKEYQVISVKRLTVKNIIALLSDIKPNIIYWRYNKKGLLKISFVSKLMKIKFIYSLSHVNDITKWVGNSWVKAENPYKNARFIIGDLKSKIISRINYLALYLVDGVVSLKEDFLVKLPNRFTQDNSIHIYNSMDFSPDNNFVWEKPYVVWVANIKKPKNPELYIDLAKHFESSDVDFLMVGKIQDSSYEYLLNKDNLPDNLYYLGKKSVHEVDSILSNALFMIHTCEPEGFGNNFIQAWYAGKPTLTLYFDPDGLIEKHNIGNLSGDYDTLRNHVELLLNNSELRKKMGENANSIAVELFNPMRNAKKLEGFIYSMISRD